jgi:hypothetical protein
MSDAILDILVPQDFGTNKIPFRNVANGKYWYMKPPVYYRGPVTPNKNQVIRV